MSFKLFIILHIKPHPKKKRLKSTYDCEDEGHSVYVRDVSCYSPDIKQSYGQGNTGSKEDKRKEEKEYERMKILYHILKNKSLPESFKQNPAYLRNNMD